MSLFFHAVIPVGDGCILHSEELSLLVCKWAEQLQGLVASNSKHGLYA